MCRYRLTTVEIQALFAVEGMGAAGVQGSALAAGQDDPDPDWQPM